MWPRMANCTLRGIKRARVEASRFHRLVHRPVTVAFPPLVGSHLDLVAADVHAAPPARALFAGVKEVDDARFTLAHA